MKLRFVYKILPLLIFYEDTLEDAYSSWAAKTNGMFIRIRKDYEGDEAIIRHEMVHVKQFYRTFSIHAWLYLGNSTYRYKAELEAFREQLKWEPKSKLEQRVNDYANLLANVYGVGVDFNQARSDLLREE